MDGYDVPALHFDIEKLFPQKSRAKSEIVKMGVSTIKEFLDSTWGEFNMLDGF